MVSIPRFAIRSGPKAAFSAACALAGVAALAHHSRVEYVGNEIHEVEGEVVRLVWRNPHIMITVRETGRDGRTVDWVLEGPGAGTAARDGLSDGHVALGDHVQAAGNRSARRDTWLRLAHVMGPSGTELIFSGSRPLWSNDYIGGDRAP